MSVALGVCRVSYFSFLDPSWFHRSASTSTTAVYIICYTAVIHSLVRGWIAPWASLLYDVLLYCCKWVVRSLRCCCVFLSCVHSFVGYIFLFSFFSRYTGPALAWQSSVPFCSNMIKFYNKLKNVSCEYDRVNG